MSTFQKISLKDEKYPSLLKEITKPPEEIYYRGDVTLLDSPAIAIVGSRKTSSYGSTITKLFTNTLAINGLTIVSGLALGTDALAHKETLAVQGKTIAVLGSGINEIAPKTNLKLAEDIINSGGLVISEFEPDTPPYPGNFPQRNRIIAGLSLGTLVTQAAKRSGALITAYYALEQNREVFTVPGSIFDQNSQGPNQLIKAGAQVVTSPDEILNALEMNHSLNFIKPQAESEEEELIMDILKHEPLHIDKIVRLARLDTYKVSSTLSTLELKGVIKDLGGQTYSSL